MTSKRSHGDGGLYWSERRQRWVAEVTTGYDGRGKRVTARRYRRTKTAAKDALQELQRDLADGLSVADQRYTVADAVTEWLSFGLSDREESTRVTIQSLCDNHLLPYLGARRLRELKAPEVEKWLAGRADVLAKSSLTKVKSCLDRSIRRAMAQDRVRRNVVELVVTPTGQPGRPSKSLTPEQVDAVLDLAKPDRAYGYIVVSLLTGARTEELRDLRRDHVYLEPTKIGGVEVPPHIAVWRSVRRNGETKTRKSRRTIALPGLCIEALRRERALQAAEQLAAGDDWVETGLVFTTRSGTALDAANVRRDFRRALRVVNAEYAKRQQAENEPVAPVLNPDDWTPRELRHSFVSLLSDMGLDVDKIAMLVGHAGGSKVTEAVYRHQLRPVIQVGALAFDDRFKASS